ncbi:hypothetical protein FRB95_002062, partial [Tulasnella sp. JGI-2019a]
MDKLRMAVTTTGTRNSGLTPVMELVINLGKELQKQGQGSVTHTKEAAEALLLQELNDQNASGCINPLLGIP